MFIELTSPSGKNKLLFSVRNIVMVHDNGSNGAKIYSNDDPESGQTVKETYEVVRRAIAVNNPVIPGTFPPQK